MTMKTAKIANVYGHQFSIGALDQISGPYLEKFGCEPNWTARSIDGQTLGQAIASQLGLSPEAAEMLAEAAGDVDLKSASAAKIATAAVIAGREQRRREIFSRALRGEIEADEMHRLCMESSARMRRELADIKGQS